MAGPPSTPLDYPDELSEASGERVVRSEGRKIGCLKKDAVDDAGRKRISAKSMEDRREHAAKERAETSERSYL